LDVKVVFVRLFLHGLLSVLRKKLYSTEYDMEIMMIYFVPI